MAEAAGPLVARPRRVPRAAPPELRRPGVLHLSLRADGAGHPRRAVEEPARADGARRAGDPARHLRDVFSSAAGIVWNTDVERRFVSVRVSSARARRGRRRLRRGPARGEASTDPRRTRATAGRRMAASRCRRTSRDPPTRSGAGTASTARLCCTAAGSIRARAARSCSSTSRRSSQEGGDATLMLMGVKLMPLPDDPRVRFAGMLPDEERLHALEAATVVVVPSPYESLSLLALEVVRGRHASPRQRALGGAGRPLPAQQRRAFLRGSVGIRRGAEAAAPRSITASGDGPERARVHSEELSVEHHSFQIRAAVHAHSRRRARRAREMTSATNSRNVPRKW